jgi:hypothetical protein
MTSSSSSGKFNIQQKQQQNEFQVLQTTHSINYNLFSSKQTSTKKSPVLLTSFRYQSFNDDIKPSFNDLKITRNMKDDSICFKSDYKKLCINEKNILEVKKEQEEEKDFLSKSKLNYFNKNNYDIINESINSNKLNNSNQQPDSIFLKKYALKRHHSAPQSDVKWLQVLFFITKNNL